jgi:hypothetical protein
MQSKKQKPVSKQSHRWFFVILFIIFPASSCNYNITRQELGGEIFFVDGVYKLSNDNLQMLIDAAYGGRVISLKYDSVEMLTCKGLHEENFGSTFWIAPQKDWGWPPYPVLDVEPYKAEIHNKKLVLISAEDRQSGFKVVKEFQILSNNVLVINYIIKNISSTEKKAAPWEVTRVPSFGMSFFPGSQEYVLSQSDLALEEHEGIMWYAFSEAEKSRKGFANGNEGWLAHVHQNILFVKVFEDILPKEVAPKEEEIEIYAHYSNTYIELENQGAYQKLQPGDSIVWPVKWYLKHISQNLSIEAKNMALVDEVRQLIGL